jgi:hypothetical protein
LSVANTQILQEDAGMRPFLEGIQKVIVILTDGESTENKTATIDNANILKNRGVHIIPIGVTSDINQEELNGMASNIDDVYNLNDFDQFSNIIDGLTKSICMQPAVVKTEKVVQSTIQRDAYKYFSMPLESLIENNGSKGQRVVTIQLQNLKGNSNFYYSFVDEHPKDNDEFLFLDEFRQGLRHLSRTLRSVIEIDDSSSKYYQIEVPSKVDLAKDKLYFSIKGLGETNEFKFLVHEGQVGSKNKSQKSTSPRLLAIILVIINCIYCLFLKNF